MAIYVVLDPVGKPICYCEANSPQNVARYFGADYTDGGELFFPPELFVKEEERKGRRVFRKGSLEITTFFPDSGVMLRIEPIQSVKIPEQTERSE